MTSPKEYAEDIRAIAGPRNKGFGSVRVAATSGSETWQTSIFPDTKTKSFVLPIKKEIRQKCGIKAGQLTKVELTLRDY